ncbi:MAG: cation-translocating P-type ATPase [Bdellovibrionaceae bacterium]|nr:cation-translocating P-type ATPase [Pseudobdellovibrionaceae bacterium]
MAHDHACKSCETTSTEKLDALSAGESESVFRISGADCSDEVNAIKKALAKIGVSSVSVNLIASTATVHHPKEMNSDKIRSAIESTGVRVVDKEETSFLLANKQKVLLVAASGVLIGLGFILDWKDLLSDLYGALLYGAAVLIAGALVFPKAWRALKQRSMDMNVLMSAAAIGAFSIKEYSEGATVVFLFALAELLEAFSVARARQAIKSVLKLTPQLAWLKKDGAVVSVPVLEVKVDDTLIVRPGDSFPLDGVVMEGNSSANQAPLTGESNPVDKKPGDSVFAGTINEASALTIKVTKAFQDTKISRVMKLIEEAQEQKAPSERFVDKFAKVYTPVVFVLAVLVAALPPLLGSAAGFDVWFYRALVLLVIACPCALVLATPISVVSGLASLAKQGVLVKGGKYLEALGKIRAIALDKTGTITEGKFRVHSFRKFDQSLPDAKVMSLALSLENMSSHPLAKAVQSFAKDNHGTESMVSDYTSIAGRGAEGRIESCLYFVGNHRLAHDLGICSPDIENYLVELEQKSLSVVIIGHKPHADHKGSVLGIFGLGDTLKANAGAAIAALHEAGIERIEVLSGDNQKTVDAIAAQTGIDQGRGDLLPEDKVREVKRLTAEYTNVAMVGDGVNDAPALASATIGISMGAAGTDTAIETSDVSLMQDDLSQLAKAIRQGRRVLSVIRFNIGFAIATKAVFLVLAIAGISNLWLAVAADMGASILVTLNALRLLRVQTSDEG